MDFKNYVQSNKQKKNQSPAADQMNDIPMNDVEAQIRQYENMSRNDMMSELRKAKQSGSLNDQSLRQFMDAMGNNLTQEQRRSIINLVNSLK